MRKAQIFSMELVFAISIFLILITSSAMLWNNYVGAGEKASLQKSMQTKAFSAVDVLVKGPETADEPNIVSVAKANSLFTKSYQDLRSSLAIAPYEFYLRMYCINQTYTPSNQVNASFKAPNLSNNNSGSPDLAVEKTLSESSVSFGDVVSINLSVMGVGKSNITHPVDVVLIMDRSSSMAGTKLTDAKNAAKNFTNKLNASEDTAALVSFTYGPSSCDNRDVGCYAMINQNLTSNFTKVKSAIDSLTASGYTAIGEGIKNSTNELVHNGRSNASHILVLLSDGNNNRGSDPVLQAKNASNNSIKIFTIGLGNDTNVTLMKTIANTTGGKYYYAPNSSDLEDVYQQIVKEITDIAAKNVTITDYLHPGITIIPPLPADCSQNITNGVTIVECKIPEDVNINETFSFILDVRVSNNTANSTNILSYTNFTNYKNQHKSKYFTDPLINVMAYGYCADFSSKTLGNYPPANAEVVVTKRIAKAAEGTMFIELYVWSENNV